MKLSAIPVVIAFGCSPSNAPSSPTATAAGGASAAETSIEVFVVLQEDEYETQHGDGYYAYYSAAFRTRADAETYAKRKAAEPRSKDTSGYGYHVRPGKLTRGADGAWTMIAELKENERIEVNGDSVKTDYKALAESLGAGK